MGVEGDLCARHILLDVRVHVVECLSSGSRSVRCSSGKAEPRVGVGICAAVSSVGYQSIGFQETHQLGLRRDLLASHGRGLRCPKHHTNGPIESFAYGQGNSHHTSIPFGMLIFHLIYLTIVFLLIYFFSISFCRSKLMFYRVHRFDKSFGEGPTMPDSRRFYSDPWTGSFFLNRI